MHKQQPQRALAESPRIYLRRLSGADALEHYLDWLNDKEVQRYTRRRGSTSSMEDLRLFLRHAETTTDYHLAICLKDSHKHIGNISLNSIDARNKSAELSIMLGDRSEWGKAYGREAVELLTQFAFLELNLHRVWAESPNPAFNKLMLHCGWTREGIKREAFLFEGKFIDLECWSRLSHEKSK